MAQAIGGHRLAKKRNNQPIVNVSGGGGLEERRDLGGTCGGTPYCRFGCHNERQKK